MIRAAIGRIAFLLCPLEKRATYTRPGEHGSNKLDEQATHAHGIKNLERHEHGRPGCRPIGIKHPSADPCDFVYEGAASSDFLCQFFAQSGFKISKIIFEHRVHVHHPSLFSSISLNDSNLVFNWPTLLPKQSTSMVNTFKPASSRIFFNSGTSYWYVSQNFNAKWMIPSTLNSFAFSIIKFARSGNCIMRAQDGLLK